MAAIFSAASPPPPSSSGIDNHGLPRPPGRESPPPRLAFGSLLPYLQLCQSVSHRWIQHVICGLKETRFAAILLQPHHQGNMAFAGKYEFEGDENYDEFVKKIGLPSDKIEMGRNCKIVTEVVQDGNDFTWTQHFPGGRTTSNTFTIGKEANMETMGGKKFKATVKMEDGKLVADFPNYHHTAEISGGKLVEISTSSGVVYKRTSKRIA
ncbi:LOW QUALITY PROTEIN: gastrotropin [Phaethornis superciliosus]